MLISNTINTRNSNSKLEKVNDYNFTQKVNNSSHQNKDNMCSRTRVFSVINFINYQGSDTRVRIQKNLVGFFGGTSN